MHVVKEHYDTQAICVGTKNKLLLFINGHDSLLNQVRRMC